MSFVTLTPSANILINTKVQLCSIETLLPFEEKEKFDKLCREGCPNFGRKWACPPYSPLFSKYSSDYKYALIVVFSCEISQFNYISSQYLKVKAANAILKSQIDKLLRICEQLYDVKSLSNGSCRLCKPCSRKKGMGNCQKPNLMRYSMESLGLNVVNVSKDLLGHQLLWYKSKKAPDYTSVVSCLLSKEEVDESIICKFL